jgi:hypothetical protein
MTVKCLSVRQPWAWLIIHGGKNVENRTWKYPPKYRGRLYIHASQGIDLTGYSVRGVKKIPSPDQIERGGLIGYVDFIGVNDPKCNSPWAEPGLMHLDLINPVPICFFPCKGQLGIFNVELPG